MSNNFSLTQYKRGNKSDLELVDYVYHTSFPEEERRPFNLFCDLLETSDIFKLFIIKNGDVSVGFITLWDFGGFAYVEHFALHPERRGGGAGAFVINDIYNMIDKPVVLEVEPPTDEIAIRRIGFYERAGFILHADLDYIQPPYVKGGESLHLKLMTKGTVDMNKKYNEVVSEIYSKVYNAVYKPD